MCKKYWRKLDLGWLATNPCGIFCVQDKITSADFETIEGVIERLGQDTKLIIEREELKDLKEEITDYIEDISNLEDITKQAHNLRVRKT